MRKKSRRPDNQTGTIYGQSKGAWTIVDVPSLHGMVRVSICGDPEDHSLMFYSGIQQILQSLILKGWDSGIVSISLLKEDDGTPTAFTLVTRSDTTAT